MAGVQAVLTSVIFLLSIRHGEGGLRPAEAIMIALAGAGVIERGDHAPHSSPSRRARRPARECCVRKYP